MRRRHMVVAAWLILTAGMGAAAPIAGADRKPNLLLIVGDDMGDADIGVHGATDLRTPHLDALAQHGTRFSSGSVTDIGGKVNLPEKKPARVKALETAWKKWRATLEEPRWLPGRRGGPR